MFNYLLSKYSYMIIYDTQTQKAFESNAES